MNFSIHLPQPLLVNLDNFAKTNKLSRSGVVREAVESYLAQKTKSEWSPEMLAWMQSPPDAKDTDDWPDFDAIRKEANESWEVSSARNLKDFSD
jgi:Arc/MetJ-type ribon-helix-helix transcriptional regulator